MKRTVNPKILTIIAGFTLVLGAGVVYWQFSSMLVAKARITMLQRETPTEAELMSSLADTQDRLADFKLKLAHLESSVPDVAYVPTLMKELEEVGIRSGIKVIGVRPVPESIFGDDKGKKDSPYNEIEIDVTGRGDYAAIQKFLADLLEFPKVLAVKKLNISPKRELGDTANPELEATITISAFVFPFEAAQVPDEIEEADEDGAIASNEGGTNGDRS
ncbi:MAG: type 4a pilus biogenesis protein PilO [Armatimonadetes bacterium]|nr:type 4a pilus biogenesis protein PilO [Armatimonadota bacterium]